MAMMFQKRPIRSSSAGVLAGILSIIFGLLGVFTIGLIFVPLAAVCSSLGILRALIAPNVVGLGLSIVGGLLTFAGYAASPSLIVLSGLGIVANQLSGSTDPDAAVVPLDPTQASVQNVHGLIQQIGRATPGIMTDFKAVEKYKNEVYSNISDMEAMQGWRSEVFSADRSMQAATIHTAYFRIDAGHFSISRSLENIRAQDALVSILPSRISSCDIAKAHASQDSEITKVCDRFAIASRAFASIYNASRGELESAEALHAQAKDLEKHTFH